MTARAAVSMAGVEALLLTAVKAVSLESAHQATLALAPFPIRWYPRRPTELLLVMMDAAERTLAMPPATPTAHTEAAAHLTATAVLLMATA